MSSGFEATRFFFLFFFLRLGDSSDVVVMAVSPAAALAVAKAAAGLVMGSRRRGLWEMFQRCMKNKFNLKTEFLDAFMIQDVNILPPLSPYLCIFQMIRHLIIKGFTLDYFNSIQFG